MENELYGQLLARVDEMVKSRVEQVVKNEVERIVERKIAAMRAEGLQGLTDEFIAAVLLNTRKTHR